jgi:hypothetical protein
MDDPGLARAVRDITGKLVVRRTAGVFWGNLAAALMVLAERLYDHKERRIVLRFVLKV